MPADLAIPAATLILLVVLALAFDFMNGFHDAANSIATVVSTGVLRPHYAVLWAAFFNFLAIFTFHLKVAATVGKGIVDPHAIDHYVIFGALVGAIAWNLITWYYGIPSSSSHALIGGMIGATVSKAGTDPLVAAGILKTAAFIFISPLLGMLLGALITIAVSWACVRASPRKVDTLFRRLQLVSSACYSVGHGSNDAQKTMGQKITKLRPFGGFAAESAGSITLFMASGLGIPVSTTHTITGAIVGVGSAQRARAVRWGVAGNIVVAWIVTMPAAALFAALAYFVGRQIL
jgi:PiT family inorganic phosphate transporter